MFIMKPILELNKLKKQFLEYLEIEKNRSRLTVRDYNHYLSRLIDFAKKRSVSSPAGIDYDLVRQYRLWLNRFQDQHGRELKLVTQNYHVIALRSFLKYLARRDIKTLAAERIELAKPPARQVEFLENDDLEKLLHAPNREKNELNRLRDAAILELLFSTGLRISELCALKRSDVNLKKEEFAVRGKGDKFRIVFLSPAARESVKKYLDERPDNSPALFVRHNRNLSIDDNAPLTPRSVQRLIKKYARLAGISHHITPHTLRHTMATDLLAAGADLRSVQEILGHSSITTTQIYTHFTNKRLKEIHKTFHGRFRKT